MTQKELGDLDYAGDDRVVPFHVEALDIRGRAVQMGPALDRIIKRHNYPAPVSGLLSEIVVLTVLLGTSLKFDGRLIVQTQTDGPVSLVVADFVSPGGIRAYARFDHEKVAIAEAEGGNNSGALLGNGTMALTIDQGQHTQRYQGVVQLDGTSIEDAARVYFRQSEQIPTEIKLGVAKLVVAEGGQPAEQWRAGGLISQFLPESEERIVVADLPSGNDDIDALLEEVHDDAWQELLALMDTVDSTEVLDPTVGSERLLYRLFYQRGVRVFEGTTVKDQCSCSRSRIAEIISGFDDNEFEQCIEDGQIHVNCEFCSTNYHFEPGEFR